MNSGGRRCRELIGVGERVGSLIDEGPVWVNEDGIAVADRTGGGPPRESLQDRAHLWRLSQSLSLYRGGGHQNARGRSSILPKAFVVQEKEQFILHNGAAHTHPVLSKTKGGN